MKFLRRLDVRLTGLALVVFLVAALVQSVVSILFIIHTYNEYSLQEMRSQWRRVSEGLTRRGCRDTSCIAEAARDFSFFDEANPAFLTDPEGRVLLKLPSWAGVDVGTVLRPRETMGDLYIARSTSGAELAFVRGDLTSGGDLLGHVYVYQYPVEEARGYFGFVPLYGPLVVRGVIVSLVVAVVLAAALFTFLTRRLRRLTDAVAAYRPEAGLPDLAFPGGDEIAVLAARFKEMAARIGTLIAELRHAEEARKQLIAGISHDLRSPVTSIGVGLELLDGTGADGKVLGSLREDVEFLGRLIEDLFEIVQIKDRPGGPERAPELVREILERAGRALYPSASARGVAVEVVPGDLPETMEINGRLIYRLLDNLLRNAIAHAPSGSTVRLAGRVEDGRAMFEVTDQGPGLDRDAEAIFARYVSRRKGGVGLGLALAREIALAHGGTIAAANRPEGGARFSVRIPLSRPA
jgi:signal transduction histidine kinase